MSDPRHAALCYILYTYGFFNFDINPTARPRILKAIKKMHRACAEEYPTYESVMMCPNNLPEGWMALVDDEEVRNVMTEFEFFPSEKEISNIIGEGAMKNRKNKN